MNDRPNYFYSSLPIYPPTENDYLENWIMCEKNFYYLICKEIGLLWLVAIFSHFGLLFSFFSSTIAKPYHTKWRWIYRSINDTELYQKPNFCSIHLEQGYHVVLQRIVTYTLQQRHEHPSPTIYIHIIHTIPY